MNVYLPSIGAISNPNEEEDAETKELRFDSSVAVMSLCNLKCKKGTLNQSKIS